MLCNYTHDFTGYIQCVYSQLAQYDKTNQSRPSFVSISSHWSVVSLETARPNS